MTTPPNDAGLIRVVRDESPRYIRVVYGDQRSTQSAISATTTSAIDKAAPDFASLIESAKEIVAGATSLDDVPGLIRSSFDDLDSSALETVIRRLMFVARMSGRESTKR